MKLNLKAGSLFFMLMFSTPGTCWTFPDETTIAGRAVSISLVKAHDLAPAPWPSGHFELTTVTIRTQRNATIYDLLTGNGIEPDVESFTLVYDLNLKLAQIDPLPSGASLILPKVIGGDELQDKLRHGYLISLTLDSALREELAKRASDLNDLSGRFANLATDRFADPSTKEAMQSKVKALVGWFAYIRKTFLQRTGPPLRQQTLLGMRDELLALNSVLSSILNGQATVTSTDEEQVNAIYKDIQVQIKKYDNVMAGEPPVSDQQYKVVITILGGDVTLIKQLQVYYTWEGLFHNPPKQPFDPKPFDGVGPGSSANLTIADYMIWAGMPGRPFPPLTDQKPIAIGPIGGSLRQVALSLNQAK